MEVVSGAAITTANSVASIQSDDVVLEGTLDSGSAQVLVTVCAANAVRIGGPAGAAAVGESTLDRNELSRITSTGLLVVVPDAHIFVSEVAAADSSSVAGTVTLNATRDV